MAKEQAQAPAKAATVVKTATTTTETILGKSALKLEAGVKALAEAGQELVKLVETSDELTLKIASQEQKLEELKSTLAEDLRTGKVELQNQLKENAKALVDKVLLENGLVSIAKDELEAIRAELTKLKNEFSKDVNTAVGAAVSAKQKEFDADKKLYISEAAAKEATTQAQVKTLEDKVEFLTEQNGNLIDQLDKAGQRAVQIAQAGSIQTLNLGGDSSRK